MAEIRRAKLLITEVGQPVERPGKEGRKYTILGFTAARDGGEAQTYKTFYKSLIPLVVKGQTIEADIEDQQSTFQGLPQTEHIVVQIYQEGQPVAEKKSGGPGQGRAWGKSPEEARLERESIEGQVALKELGECIRTGVAIPPDLVNLYQTALETLVRRLVNGQPPKVETTQGQTGSLNIVAGKESMTSGGKPQEKPPEIKVDLTIKERRGKLVLWAKDKGITTEQICTLMGKDRIEDVDPDEALKVIKRHLTLLTRAGEGR